jgi:HAD superfamily hydrolase (TIGR01509 family)
MRADPSQESALLAMTDEALSARRYDAVLWDFDGVIARTEMLHTASWQRALRQVELDFPVDAFATAATEDDRDLIARTFEAMGVRLHSSQVLAWCSAKQSILVDLLTMSPPIYRNVPETMHSLAQEGYRQAIVTSTWRANVHATLEASGLLKLMDFVIAKEDVARPKPAPDGYRLAVQRMRFAPKRCLAIEDSSTGLKSAMAAGIDVVGLAHPHSPAQNRERTWTAGAPLIHDLAELARILKQPD